MFFLSAWTIISAYRAGIAHGSPLPWLAYPRRTLPPAPAGAMHMRRRPAFTLVEMMVSVALVLFIMVILTEAFGKGLESFRTLKSVGDMESRLRAADMVLRRDLKADHFEG